MKTPEQCWVDFIELLNERQQIKGPLDKKTGKYETIPHQNFLGSIKAYQKLFIEANLPGVDLTKHPEALRTLEDGELVRVRGQEMTLCEKGDKVYIARFKNGFPRGYVRAQCSFGYGLAEMSRSELEELIVSGNFHVK